MDDRVTLRPAKPPAREPETFPGRVAQVGARPLPQVELKNEVPNLGPYKMGPSTYYDLQVYPGPLLRVVSAPSSGQTLDVSA
ncbi:MAG: hypothetical protein IPM99_21590 [Rubrivivax sp.]|nr:hypothetical protein [Rubrivivax sp.]